MKNIAFLILFIFPFSASAKLKDNCTYDGRSYAEDVTIENIFGYQEVIDFKYPSLGGMEIKYKNENSYSAIIHKDDYYLFNAAKNAYLMNRKINICVTKDRLEHPFKHLLGLEIN